MFDDDLFTSEEEFNNAYLNLIPEDELTKLWYEYKFDEIINSIKYYASIGDKVNLFRIGYCYDLGLAGFNQDYKLAKKYYLKSAKLGNAIAYNNLGVLYLHGYGVRKNIDRAIDYYIKAGELGSSKAYFNLGLIFSQCEVLEPEYDLAKKFFEQAENLGNIKASTSLGILYLEGKGVRKNYKKAFDYFTKASNQDDATACNNLGLMYADGRGTKKNLDKALELYNKSIELGNSSSYKNLGYLYETNRSIRDYKKAFKYYEIATSYNDGFAYARLAYLYRKGRGCKKDYEKAIEYYLIAINLGEDFYIIDLADLFYEYAIILFFKKEILVSNVKSIIKKAIYIYENIIDYEKIEISYRLGILNWMFYALHPIKRYESYSKKSLKYHEIAAEEGHAGSKIFLETYLSKNNEVDFIN